MKKLFYRFMMNYLTKKAIKYSSPRYPSEKVEDAFAVLGYYTEKYAKAIDKR